MLRQIAQGQDPSDEAVIVAISAVLMNDDSFITHISKNQPEYLADEKNWATVYNAGAATIYQEYEEAIERHNWAGQAK
jgi:hypothetical protein